MLCMIEIEFIQDYVMIFVEHATKYAGVITIFNFRSLYWKQFVLCIENNAHIL